jgi:hypothetical protein
MIGINFPGKLVGASGPVEFSVDRYVEADNQKAARVAAAKKLKMDLSANRNMDGGVNFVVSSKLTHSGQPEVTIDEIEPMVFDEIPEIGHEGVFWFSPMSEVGPDPEITPRKAKRSKTKVTPTKTKKPKPRGASRKSARKRPTK